MHVWGTLTLAVEGRNPAPLGSCWKRSRATWLHQWCNALDDLKGIGDLLRLGCCTKPWCWLATEKGAFFMKAYRLGFTP